MKLILIFLLLVLLTINVSAIGISPGRHTTDFKPGAIDKVDIRILNNENKDMKVALYAEGDLSELVTLKDSLLDFKSTDNEISTSYEVILPEKIEKPGTHEINIVARSLANSPKSNNKEAAVGFTTAVISKLYLRVPYPDKYLELSNLNIINNGVNKTTDFILSITNLGTKNILHAKAVIDILGPTNEKLETIFSDDKPLESMQKTELVAQWLANVKPGKYHAVINVIYDSKSLRSEQIFEVGELLVDVVDVYVKDFKLGGVARFNILIESKWNEPIKDLYADMKISNSKGDDMDEIKSATVEVAPLDKAELSTFWDTEGVQVGQYDANLKLMYAGKTTERALKAIVTTDTITVEGFATGRVIGIGNNSNKNTILSILVITLIIINIGWFIYMRKKKQE